MKIKKGKFRAKLAISCIIALCCVVGIGYSGYKIVEWLIDSNNTKEQTATIEEAAEVKEIEDNSETEIIPTEDETDLYHKYLSMKLLDINFDELTTINQDTAGWISLSGTDINYPFVQTSNNDYYLKHSFDRSYNSAGWVFADFRNKLDGTDRNFILYAHGRYDGTMFGTLRNILTNNWLKNPENFTVRTVTAKETASWQVFSTYRIPTTSDYIQTDFKSDEEFMNLVEKVKNRSAHNFNTTVSATDHILTLSTCYSSTERVVLHAKLIKRAPR
jgi:sortase B